jgi:hypothetical protein
MRKTPYSIDGHLQQVPPDVLYHYTSIEAAISILKSDTVWVTDIFYLNDSSEYHKVLMAIRRRLEERIARTKDKDELANLTTYKQVIERGNSGPIYVASFSAVGDDLSQWRGYTPNGLGVCIGFNGKLLRQLALNVFGARMGRVIYIDEKDDSSFDPLLNDVAKLKAHTSPRLPRNIQAGLDAVMAAPFYKDKTFKHEREWRICLGGSLDLRAGQTIEYRSGKSMIVPYKTVKLEPFSASLLSEVYVGPSPNLDLSVSGFKRLVEGRGADPDIVEGSKIPFRPW